MGNIEQKKEGGILTLEINSPPVNSYTHEMLQVQTYRFFCT